MKRRKLKKKNVFIIFVIFLILLFEIINPFKLIDINKLENLNYSSKSSQLIYKYGLTDKIKEYNILIDNNIKDKDFNKDNINIYKKINYKVEDINLVNKLIDKKYNVEEINCILKTGNSNSIKDFIEKDKYNNLTNYLVYDYAKLENIDRYIQYERGNVSTYEDTVLKVEIGLDKEFYKVYEVVNTFSNTMIVNKYNKLPEDFIPNDIVLVDKNYSVGEEYGNKEMVNSFYKMANDLNKETNLNIYVNSGYRTYSDQESTLDKYLKLYGQKYVDKYVAYPGFSEHQTGLAVDIKASSNSTFLGTKEYEWMNKNCYKYGFIRRYEKNKESVTGYNSESWHYRYVGLEASKYIYENNLSFEEYYIKFVR